MVQSILQAGVSFFDEISAAELDSLVGWLSGFYGISTIVDYLIPNPLLYIK